MKVTRSVRSAVRRLLVPLAVGLSLTACTLPGADPTTGAPPPSSSGTGQVRSASGAMVVDTGTGHATADKAATGEPPVLASLQGFDHRSPVQVDLNDLQVTGQGTWLQFTARNTDPDPASTNSWQVAGFFADSGLTVDGITLVDTKNSKRYLAARTDQNECVCSTNLAGTFISGGKGVVLYSLFAALPPEVDTVDVVVPKLGTFSGVRPGR